LPRIASAKKVTHIARAWELPRIFLPKPAIENAIFIDVHDPAAAIYV